MEYCRQVNIFTYYIGFCSVEKGIEIWFWKKKWLDLFKMNRHFLMTEWNVEKVN